MKYSLVLLSLLFAPLSLVAQQPERKVIKPPVVKSVPRDFTRPQVRKPAGFGKQQWQQPQQRHINPNPNWNRGPVIIYNPYRYRYVHPHPIYQNWNNFYYSAQPVYPVYPVQPYFFFHFRF